MTAPTELKSLEDQALLDATAINDLLRLATASENGAAPACETYGINDGTIGQAAYLVDRLLCEFRRELNEYIAQFETPAETTSTEEPQS